MTAVAPLQVLRGEATAGCRETQLRVGIGDACRLGIQFLHGGWHPRLLEILKEHLVDLLDQHAGCGRFGLNQVSHLLGNEIGRFTFGLLKQLGVIRSSYIHRSIHGCDPSVRRKDDTVALLVEPVTHLELVPLGAIKEGTFDNITFEVYTLFFYPT